MATTTTATADIYGIAEYIEAVKQNYTELDEQTLVLGMFGYLSEIHGNALQNTVVMASEYSNEAIPTKAKFERNIIAHALSLGINKIMATPAYMDVMICIPEQYLLINMQNNKFTFDREIPIYVGDYEYHLDYDILIKRNVLAGTGEVVYTSQYEIDGRNGTSDITNPYLPPVGKIVITNMNVIVITARIRQVTYNKIYKKILVDNPLENKVITFSFEDQLAYFNLEVKEGDTTHYLTPVYDGLYDFTAEAFCNYMYLDSKTIRIVFNRDSYEPRANCEVYINVYTTKGSECNFTYSGDDIVMDLNSNRFSYDRLYMIMKCISDSEYGTDKKTIEELQRIIPKEALSRGSITTYADLNGFFNSINNDNIRLYFLEKVHNNLERLYYSYFLMKDANTNIIPTNTLNTSVLRANFTNANKTNYSLAPGTLFYYDGTTTSVPIDKSEANLAKLEESGFLYINPFLCVINKSQLIASYFLNILNKTKYLNFDYININSQVQFIASSINVKREYFTDRNTYKLTVELLQNITKDFGLATKDEDGNITDCKIKVIAILKDKAGNPYRYSVSEITDYDDKEFIYTFQFKITTQDVFDADNNIRLDNLVDINNTTVLPAYFAANTDVDLYILADTGTDNGRTTKTVDFDKYVPGLTGYTLCNTYTVDSGVDFYFNYSNISSSYVKLTRNKDSSVTYTVHKVPLIKKSYFNSEHRIQTFIKEIEKRRSYIEYCMVVLEDSFGIDFKFFNTYGPSTLYNIDNETNLNRVNMSLTFELKFVDVMDKYIADEIMEDIKKYIEDINNITDIHMPNLVTYITTKYRTQLVYFKFLDLNGYGPVKQSIYQTDETLRDVNSVYIPEFLNVNTKDDDSPDITFIIKD